MTEREILVQIVELQKADSEIQENERVKNEILQEIESRKRYIKLMRDDFAAKKTRGDDLKKKKAAIDLEIKAKEAEIKKKQEQTAMVKTNDAYKALQGEIDSMKAAIISFEDKQLEVMSEEENLVREMIEAEKRLKVDEASINEEIKKNQEQITQVESVKAGMSGRREELASKVEKKWYEKYERIRKNKGGLAVAELKVDKHGNGQCGGCGMAIRPQAVIEVMKKDSIHTCENCARLWYAADKKGE